MGNPEEQGLTPLSALGEFGLISHLTKDFTPGSDSVLKAVGDDAAVYAISDTEVHLVSTDMLVEGVHFDLSYVPLKHLGYKSVIVNLSDIFAMNGTPFGVTVSIALSNRFTVEAMDAFYEGVKLACENYGVDLLGGDTASSHKGLIISVTALGRGKKDEIVYRSGGKENDLLCVTGDLGAAYAGLQILEREKAVFLQNPEIQPELDRFDYVVGRQLKPEVPIRILKDLREANLQPNAMIDVSDGLASDLLHLCKGSDLGATIYEDKLMIDHQVAFVAQELKIPSLTMALNGGEDYELLFSLPLESFDIVKSMPGFAIIGHFTDKESGVNIVTSTGAMLPVEAQGWNHFGGSEE